MKKVVPFTRDVAYLAERARKNQRDGRLLDALALYRRAREVSGDEAYRLPIAQTLTEMGCPNQAIRELARYLALPNASPEAYFGLCCNYFSLNELDAAYRAMVRYLSMASDASRRSDVGDMLRNLMILRALNAAMPRKARRAGAYFDRAASAVQRGDLLAADALLVRACAVNPLPRARALHADVLCRLSREGEARSLALSLSREPDLPLDCIAPLVDVLAKTGDLKRAQALCRHLLEAGRDEASLMPHKLRACAALHADERIKQLLVEALRVAPYDRDVLHACAVNRLRAAHSAEQAQAFWSRMCAIDPTDDVALYYLAQDPASIDVEALTYACVLPNAEIARRRAALTQPADPNLALCRYAMRYGDHDLRYASFVLLLSLPQPEARAILQEQAFTPARMSEPTGVRLNLPPGIAGDAAMAFCETERFVRVPPRLRRALKIALLNVRNDQPALEPVLFRIVLLRVALGVRLRAMPPDMVLAAALLLAALRSEHQPAEPAAIAKRFSVSPRRVKRAADRIFPMNKENKP